jgi:hypothetical protein
MSGYIKHTPKLWESKHDELRSDWAAWCPACKQLHTWRTGTWAPGVPTWKFDGNLEKPTFSPSLRYLTGTKCHLTLTNGIIEYHTDCPHSMAGLKIPLIDIPVDDLGHLK